MSTKWLGIVGLLILFASGCGDAECGKGTKLVDGKCVSESTVRCGPGSELFDGECVPASGSGECAEGTKLVDGKCVSDSSLDCGEGTELVDGRCLVKCAEEEIRVNGACRPACDPEGSPFGGGEGTWTSPFRICTVEHLLEVRNHLGGDFVLTRNLDLRDVEGFEPLGGTDIGEGLRGRFDGNGLVLRGLKIERPGEGNVALFRRIEKEGAVRSLGLVDVTVSGENVVGALASYSEGKIEGTYATGSISGTSQYVGGLVAYAVGSIVDSYATGEVEGDERVGGLAGTGRGIVGSYATGTITGSAADGGLVGYEANEGTIQASYFLDSEEGSDLDYARGEPLTREEFGKGISFPEWDFGDTWMMKTFGAPDFARPSLRANPEKP